MVVVDPSQLSADSLARASIILAVGLLLLFSSIVTICIFLNNINLHDVINVYLTSLALTDLLCALLIVPLSLYSSLSPNWNFAGDNSLLCKSVSYLQVVLISSSIFTFAWISVDRYSAFMKPTRYEIEHTLTRCKCWITFSWITAILLACPMIVAKMEVNYHRDFELCVLNWSTTFAYSITLAVLVLLPSTFTVAFTCGAVFSAMNKPEELEDSQKTIIETDENFIVTLFVLISFILAWLPIIVIQFMPSFLIHPADSATMKFAFMWLAIGGSSTKILIYTFTRREFRRSLCAVCIYTLRNNTSESLVSNANITNDFRLDINDQWNRSITRINIKENDVLFPNNTSSSNNQYNYNNFSYNNESNQQRQQFLPNNMSQSADCCCRIVSKLATNSPPMLTGMVRHMPEYGSFARTPISTYY